MEEEFHHEFNDVFNKTEESKNIERSVMAESSAKSPSVKVIKPVFHLDRKQILDSDANLKQQ
jgi:hypothetical protein